MVLTRQRGRRWARSVAVLVAATIVILVSLGWFMLSMPGKSHSGPLPSLTEQERKLVEDLRRDVRVLATEIGERNVSRPAKLARAAAFIERELTAAGYRPQRQTFEVAGVSCDNVEVEIGDGSEIVVVGAHYDSVVGTVGANDNATGVAATLALARAFVQAKPNKTLRFVAFVNEEPPHFQTHDMGSLRYAKRSRERGERISAMLSLETMGYYSDAPESQAYPPPIALFYPSTGNFVGFVSNVGSRKLLRRIVGDFRSHTAFPSEGAALPGVVPGVGWSDHWAFWQNDYPAVMVTDTAPFRYPHYHTADDTPDKVDYPRLARVVAGLQRVVENLVR